jgi:hypothetical protein
MEALPVMTNAAVVLTIAVAGIGWLGFELLNTFPEYVPDRSGIFVAVQVPESTHAPLAVYVPEIVVPETVPVSETFRPWKLLERETEFPLTVPVSVAPVPDPRQEPTTAVAVEVTAPSESTRFAST